jgi:hypothetical protein
LHLDVLEDRCLPSLFAPFTPFTVGFDPLSVAVGDFNRDGSQDLTVANTNSNFVSILLGDGKGGFQHAVNYPAGFDATSVAVGDFAGNGILDLAVTHFDFVGTVSILLGNGDGTFQLPVTYNVGSDATSVAVGDFNRDGILDLAVTNANSNYVSILFGNGDGTFQNGGNYPAGSGGWSVAVGDFTGNGIADLAVVNSINPGTVSILLGDGEGHFSAPVPYAAGSGPQSVAVGDFRHDGITDLAVANTFSNAVSVLLGNGDGTFQKAVDYQVGFPLSVAVGDFLRNGTLDLAVANGGSNAVSIFLGNGDGTFQQTPLNFPVGNYPNSVAIGDFNQVGGPDLAVTSTDDSAVDVLLNQALVTSTAVTSNYNNAADGTPITFTATVTPSVTTRGVEPTGLVGFFDGGTQLGTGTIQGNGLASLSINSLTPGDHSIRANYEGDPNFNGSLSPALNEIILQNSSNTALSVSASPAVAGQPLTLTATVDGADGLGPPPTGTVLFIDNQMQIGSATLSGGVATLITSALAPGSHSLYAVYLGDDNFIGSTASAITEIINNPAPILTNVSQTTLPEGSAGFTVTLTGNNFVPGASVNWNGNSLTIVNLSATQIQANVPASLLGQEGTALVTVTNPSPGGGASLAQTFTITDATLSASRVNLNVHSNLNFSGTVATFTDTNGGATASDFTAIVLWDDGSANAGTVSGTGPFTVSGTHTFVAFKNLHAITVTIFDQGGSQAVVNDYVTDPTANEAYVMRLYVDLLGRQADSAGLAHWSALLDRGVSRAQVALSIEQSLEYRKDEVQALYAHYLHRNADPAGLAVFTNFLAHGGTLEQVAADLVGSGEYYQTRAGGTNAGFLDALYHDALGRNIDPSGQSLFGRELSSGASRRDIASAIFGSGEYRHDLVQGYYHSILGRSAGHGGLTLFGDALAAGTRDEAVMADIFGSEEFFTKE